MSYEIIDMYRKLAVKLSIQANMTDCEIKCMRAVVKYIPVNKLYDEYYDLRKLTVTNEDLETDFKRTGSCILRKYNGETSLILACGNSPTCVCLGSKYIYDHKHSGVYTIDSDISMNPSLVGLFGYEIFTEIPDNSFNYIEMEGLYGIPTELFFNEIKRIAKPNVVVNIEFKDRKDDKYLASLI